MDIAETLISQFTRMISRDGGALFLLGTEGQTIRIGYRMGSDANCEDGACILPHVELQDMMNETLARRAPGMKVVVQLVTQ